MLSTVSPWLTFLYPVRVIGPIMIQLFYITMNVVQLPNKLHYSIMISIIHSFISFIRRQLAMLIAENILRG